MYDMIIIYRHMHINANKSDILKFLKKRKKKERNLKFSDLFAKKKGKNGNPQERVFFLFRTF